MHHCAGTAIQWVYKWLWAFGYSDVVSTNSDSHSDTLRNIRIVNAQYPITQYRPWEQNEGHFNFNFRFDTRPMAIGQGICHHHGNVNNNEVWKEIVESDMVEGGVFDVVEKLYTCKKETWPKRNIELKPINSVSTRNSVMKVAAGADHSVAISTDHRVWTCGSNSHGQLGQGYESRNSNVFRVVESLTRERVTAVSAGYAHNVAIGSDGRVFTWGLGLAGRLGHGDEQPKFLPSLVKELTGEYVVQIASGGGHSVALTLDGRVFTFGDGTQGQLGHDKGVKVQFKPRFVKALYQKWVLKVAAGCDRTVVITKDNKVMHFGAALSNMQHDNVYLPVEAVGLTDKLVVDVATDTFHIAALVLN